jgi:hypothetical protein
MGVDPPPRIIAVASKETSRRTEPRELQMPFAS